MESGQDSYSAAGSSLEVLLRRPGPSACARAQQVRSPSPMGVDSRLDGEVECGGFAPAPSFFPVGNPAYRDEVAASADAPGTWAPISIGTGNLGWSAADAWQLRQAPRPPPGLPVPRREVFGDLGIGWRHMPDQVSVAHYPPRAVEIASGLDSCRVRDSWVAQPGEDVAETWARLEAAGGMDRHMEDACALQGARSGDVPVIHRRRWLREPPAEQYGVAGSAAVGGPLGMAPAAGQGPAAAGQGPAGSRGHQGPQPHHGQPRESRERLSSVMVIMENGELLQAELSLALVEAIRQQSAPLVHRAEDVAVRQSREQSHSAPPPRQEPTTPYGGHSGSSPLEWDYSDLSGDTEAEGLTGSVRGQATRACAREPEEREPAGQDQGRGVRPEDCLQGCGTIGTEAPVSRPPCPFSPQMVCHGPTQPRSQPQDGVQDSHVLHSTASRWVPDTVPVTTQATSRPVAAQVTWAQSQPRVATAVPSMTGTC